MEPTSFSSRLSFRLILERVKQQPSNEMAQAAVEKIRRKSYRELKGVLIFSFFCIKAKGQKMISHELPSQNKTLRKKPLEHYLPRSKT